MHPRAEYLIAELELAPHPEGGYFRRIYCSARSVSPVNDRRPERPALTGIYFLLPQGEVSRWHRVLSDEAWHFYEGAPLELVSMDSEMSRVQRNLLGPVEVDVQPAHVVPAGTWQAARTLGDYTFVGCSVGPGFDFEDFQLLKELSAESEKFRRLHPEWTGFI